MTAAEKNNNKKSEGLWFDATETAKILLISRRWSSRKYELTFITSEWGATGDNKRFRTHASSLERDGKSGIRLVPYGLLAAEALPCFLRQ